jgi:N-acetylated-alpha-linked acidic dipeptidase
MDVGTHAMSSHARRRANRSTISSSRDSGQVAKLPRYLLSRVERIQMPMDVHPNRVTARGCPHPALALAVLALSTPQVHGLRAQTGFSTRAAVVQANIEQRLLQTADTGNARIMTRDLSAHPHMAGTRAQAETRDYVIAKLQSWGLETWVKEYTVFLPQPVTVNAWVYPRRGAPAQRLNLVEPPIPGDPATTGPQVPSFNAYSGDGDVTAPVVDVNYGLDKDYRMLDSLGVSVRGRIALARYGYSFRGIKEREAARHGAIGLILYSDPQDDGYFHGDVYPRGPMRPPGGIQRGSVLNRNGDPTTPGYASLPGAPHLPEDSLALAYIPVVPIGYGNAQLILARLGGPPAPEGWQGGLPLHYHVGPGPARVRLQVRMQHGVRALHPIWNTFAMIRGSTYPDEWIMVGAHRDAWSPGAADNVSGTVTVLETARAFAELAREGIRPARTLLFATWDAEEWGLIGSTEWVEEQEDSVRAHVVAYINEDDVTNGLRFAGAGTPSLKPFIREVTRAVADPTGWGSVYDTWLVAATGDTMALRIDNLGGGSDFTSFSHHIGVPSATFSFGGPSGVYHSMYDSYEWMSRFGDPGYREHQAVAQLVTIALARLANAEILPFDYWAFGIEMMMLAAQIDTGIGAHRWNIPTGALWQALVQLTYAGEEFATARDSALSNGVDTARAAAANHWLMQVERRLTRPRGLVGRSWFRSLQFASDIDNGYATIAFPSVAEAIRYADAPTTERELADLVSHINLARQAIEQATAALR